MASMRHEPYTDSWWLARADGYGCSDMLEMLDNASARKLRLFAAAVARRVWPLLSHRAHRRTIEIAEQCADGLAAWEELDRVCRRAQEYADQYITVEDQRDISPGRVAFSTALKNPSYAAFKTYSCAMDVVDQWGQLLHTSHGTEVEAQSLFVLDI